MLFDLRRGLSSIAQDGPPYSGLEFQLICLDSSLREVVVIFTVSGQDDCVFSWKAALPFEFYDEGDASSALDASLVVFSHFYERIGALGQPPLEGRPGVLVEV